MTINSRAVLVALLLAGAAMSAAAEEGVTDSTILIGQTIGLTGPISDIAKGMTAGANAYIENVNNHGGVNGRKIVLRILDDKFAVKPAADNAEKLIKEDHVFALFQSYGTPQTIAIFPIMAASGVPLVAPSPGPAIFHTPFNRLVFNVRAKFQDEVRKGVEQFTTVGINSIGLLIINDAFGKPLLDTFTHALEERKLAPQIIEKFDLFKPDVKGVVAAVVKSNPKALIITGPPQHSISFIKAIRAAGSKMQIMVLSNNSSATFAANLGPAGVGVIVSQIMPPPNLISSELGKEFLHVTKASGLTPSYAAIEGFASAKVLVEGLRRAGRNLTREQFIRGLETMKKVDLGGVVVNFTPTNHSGSDFVELTMIDNTGRFIR